MVREEVARYMTQQTVKVERHYSVAAIADLLGVSNQWVCDLEDEYPTFRLGNLRRRGQASAALLT